MNYFTKSFSVFLSMFVYYRGRDSQEAILYTSFASPPSLVEGKDLGVDDSPTLLGTVYFETSPTPDTPTTTTTTAPELG